MSIEYLWKYFDTSNHFKSIKTLRNYFSSLLNQIDNILKIISKNIVQLRGYKKHPVLFPDEQNNISRIKLVIKLIIELLKILHEENIDTILNKESPFYLQYLIYIKSNLILLKPP